MSSVDGLVSGMNTTDIIRQLMSLERAPVTRMQATKAATDKAITALQGLNTKYLALTDLASKLDTSADWSRVTGTASHPDSAGVTVAAGTAPTSLSFVVKSLSAAHQIYSTTTYGAETDVVAAAANPITIGYTDGAGAPANLVITNHTGTLRSVADAINADPASPITARIVKTTDTGAYRLELTAKTSGANSAFTVTGIGNPPDPDMDFAVATQASDAEILLGSSATPLSIKSASNTIANVVPGVSLTLKKADLATTVTVNVARDSAGLADDVEKLANAANEILKEIKTLTAYDPLTKKAGVLYGNPEIRQLQYDVLQAVSGAVDSKSAAAAGLETTREGTLKFDKAKFTTAYAANPAAIGALFFGANGSEGVAQRLVGVSDKATKFGTGVLTQSIDVRRNQIKRIDDSIASWDVRLAAKESRLRKQFAALETALGSAQQQGNWLAGQLSSLPKWD
jgi:flagellar hook-associated protein 2